MPRVASGWQGVEADAHRLPLRRQGHGPSPCHQRLEPTRIRHRDAGGVDPRDPLRGGRPPRAPALVAYPQQALEERGFSRLKTRNLHIRPVSLRDDTRLAGLLGLLCLALRVLTLTEHRLRTALAERAEELAGLNPASHTQSTSRPTTERVLAAFPSIPLTTIGTAGGSYHHVTPLNATQRHILALLELPDNLYERLARPATNFVLHLRE